MPDPLSNPLYSQMEGEEQSAGECVPPLQPHRETSEKSGGTTSSLSPSFVHRSVPAHQLRLVFIPSLEHKITRPFATAAFPPAMMPLWGMW